MNCPRCGSDKTANNGGIRTVCRTCNKSFNRVGLSDDPEIDFYQPEPISLGDGDILIFDPIAFAEKHKCLEGFVMVKDGMVWVLDDATNKMRNIELKKVSLKSVKDE